MQAVAMTGGANNQMQVVAMIVGTNNQMQAVAMTDGTTNEMQAAAMTDGGSNDGIGHTLVFSGDIVWCKVCASYADSRAHVRGIAGECRGPPTRKRPHDYGGMWWQMQKLKSGRHPKTGEALPPPIDGAVGERTTSLKRYVRLDQKREANQASNGTIDVDDTLSSAGCFTPYVPEPPRVMKPSLGRSVKEKFAEMRQRVRQRELHNLKRFRLRGKQKPPTTL